MHLRMCCSNHGFSLTLYVTLERVVCRDMNVDIIGRVAVEDRRGERTKTSSRGRTRTGGLKDQAPMIHISGFDSLGIGRE